jgi:hypothetical protein
LGRKPPEGGTTNQNDPGLLRSYDGCVYGVF